jgi:hypothetical protein
MLDVGMPTDEFFQKVKKVAINWIEVPPMAEYEIKWSPTSPLSSEEQQKLSQILKGSGPMLIATLTD